MLLGTRGVYRGIATFSFSPSIHLGLGAPLLFLYPRWLRTAATAARNSDGERSGTPALKRQDDAFQSIKTKRQSLPQAPGGSSNSISDNSLGPKFENVEDTSRSDDFPPQTVSSDGEEADERHMSSSYQSSAKREHARGVRRYGRFTKHGHISMIVKTLDTASTQKNYKRTVVEDYQEMKRNERGATIPNWRDILRDLDLYTPMQSGDWHSHALMITVPAVTLENLLFGMNDNIWEIKRRTGCHIELSFTDAHDAAEYRTLLLSGNINSISQATGELLRLAPGSVCSSNMGDRRPPTFNTSSIIDFRSDRGILSRRIRVAPRTSLATPKRADTIERPAEWTAASFAVYVQSLTRMKISSHMATLLYQSKNAHHEMVLYLLEHLFFDPEAKDAISVTAFNDALTYTMRLGRIKLARQLFVRMEMLNLPVNTESFNIMLRRCAQTNDLGTFKFLLKMMVHRGYTPDASTWLAFIQTVRNGDIKQFVIEMMTRKGIFHNPAIRKEAWEQLVTGDIQQALDERLTHDEFLRHMSNKYSEDWLNVGSASRILHILASHGLVSRCWEFVQYMLSREVEPNKICYDAILNLCKKHENVDGALEIFYLMASPKMPMIEESTYEILFSAAWKSQSLSLILVLWRYACLDTATTFGMRKRISDSMRRASSGQNEPDFCRVGLLADSLPQVIDVAIDPDDRASSSHAVTALRSQNMCREAIKNQMEQGKYWKPTRSLAGMLLAARAVDIDYISSGAQDLPREQSLAWLKEHAVKIPLVSRRLLRKPDNVQALW